MSRELKRPPPAAATLIMRRHPVVCSLPTAQVEPLSHSVSFSVGSSSSTVEMQTFLRGRRVGYWLSEKKMKKLNFQAFADLCRCVVFGVVVVIVITALMNRSYLLVARVWYLQEVAQPQMFFLSLSTHGCAHKVIDK